MNTPTKLLGINVSYDEKGNNQMNFNLRKVQNLQTKLDIWQQKYYQQNKTKLDHERNLWLRDQTKPIERI